MNSARQDSINVWLADHFMHDEVLTKPLINLFKKLEAAFHNHLGLMETIMAR